MQARAQAQQSASLKGHAMKRLHVHVSVADLSQSIGFYSALFAAKPSVVKPDYAKWMLEDPRVNFAISTRPGRAVGISHLGIQAEDEAELAEVYDRLARAERPIVEAKATTCCYAQSDKQWIADPQGVPWETFYTYGESTVYGKSGVLNELAEASGGLSTCGCGPAEITALHPEPAATGACCGD
jgi:Glyoxalase/Bleomycin resistance protein/Dioxygenase superfamily